MYAQLGINGLDVILDRVWREVQTFGYLLVTHTIIDKAHNTQLCLGQPCVELWEAYDTLQLALTSHRAVNFLEVEPPRGDVKFGRVELSKIAFGKPTDNEILIIWNVGRTLLILLFQCLVSYRVMLTYHAKQRLNKVGVILCHNLIAAISILAPQLALVDVKL